MSLDTICGLAAAALGLAAYALTAHYLLTTRR